MGVPPATCAALLKISSLAGVARSDGVGEVGRTTPEVPACLSGDTIFIERGSANRRENSP